MQTVRGLSDRKQAGDTIVEVLIAILVIASILTGAFLVSQQSTRNVRNSEEHSEALNALQAQIELLRSAAPNGTVPTDGSTFCMDGDTPVAASDDACLQQDLYQVSIQSIGNKDSSTDTVTYQATATWAAIGSATADQQVQLLYKTAVGSGS